MAQAEDLNYFLTRYQGLINRYPRLEVNILQKFNTPNNPEVEIRLNNLTNNQLLSPYMSGDYPDYPDAVNEVLKKLNRVRGGRKRRRESKRQRHRHSKRCRQSKRCRRTRRY
jgi:hypothetical protein